MRRCIFRHGVRLVSWGGEAALGRSQSCRTLAVGSTTGVGFRGPQPLAVIPAALVDYVLLL